MQNWQVRKPAARSRRGIVASQHQLAAEVGAEMLAAGGNAVDAAVAAGFGLALERFGTRALATVLQPAIALAEKGIAVDWYLTLKVATQARELACYSATRDIWLPAGMPPVTPPDTPLRRLKLAGLAESLRRLARAGCRDFYEGEIAAAIAKDIHAMGGVLAPEDLGQYRARIVAPTQCDYRGATVALAPRLT